MPSFYILWLIFIYKINVIKYITEMNCRRYCYNQSIISYNLERLRRRLLQLQYFYKITIGSNNLSHGRSWEWVRFNHWKILYWAIAQFKSSPYIYKWKCRINILLRHVAMDCACSCFDKGFKCMQPDERTRTEHLL